MEIDVGLDTSGLTYDGEAQLMAHAAGLGYARVWVASVGDPFQTCALRWAASRAAVPDGIGTAIGVMPVTMSTPAALALSAAALSSLTQGRFILGIGAGGAYEPAFRRTWGVGERSPLTLIRAYLTTIRGLLAGEHVTYHGSGISYEDARLPHQPAPTPLYLGAGGPKMTMLGGELADGLYLSWCTPDNVRWIRSLIAEGAARAGRDPAEVKLAASVRVCIDEDPHIARKGMAAALLPYVLGWDGPPPRANRANFERMGFGPEMAEIDRVHEQGVKRQQIIDMFPERMLRGLGYFGPAAGAAEAIRRQVNGADIAVVRIVTGQASIESMRTALDACQPVPGNSG
jgi:5,10-methylenetetrahydromethanopterin reductase